MPRPAFATRLFASAALAAVAASALLLEVTLVRLLSVALWYPFAFAALATAMLGFGDANGLTGSEILVRYTFYGDADLSDFVLFQGCFNGPNHPPNCQ